MDRTELRGNCSWMDGWNAVCLFIYLLICLVLLVIAVLCLLRVTSKSFVGELVRVQIGKSNGLLVE